MGDFSHLNTHGESAMVDICHKTETQRIAVVRGVVRVSEECCRSLNLDAIREIISTARIAGIQAAKKTAYLIPLCHQVPLSAIDINIKFEKSERCFTMSLSAKTKSATGVEMEAMVAANIAGSTIYDMIKAVDPTAEVGPFSLVSKVGGKSGDWRKH